MKLLTIDPRPTTFDSALEELCVFVVVSLSQFLSQAGTAQSLPMMNVLGDTFANTTTADKSWFLAAFPLTTGAFILISGKFGDVYGLKKALMFGLVFSIIWSLLSGLSGYTSSVAFFCICRAFQGIGFAFILPNAIGIVGRLYPPGQRKALVFAAVGAMAPLGASTGTVFSGLLAHYGHWQWAYYCTSIALFLVLLLTVFLVPDLGSERDSKMDWLGATIGVAGLVVFNFATNQAPAVGWDEPYVIVLIIVGVLIMVAFFWMERRLEHPLVPQAVMNGMTALILVAISFGWGSFSIWCFYYWSVVLNLKHWNPLQGAAPYAVIGTFGVVAAFTVGFTIRRVRPSFLLLASSCAFFIGITMLSQTPPSQRYFDMLFAQQIIIPFGMDLSFPAASLILSDNLPKQHQGMASSLVSTFMNYGMSISLGFAGTADAKVLQHTGDLLQSYRAAMYVGVGFASCGILLSTVLIILSYHLKDPFAKKDNNDEEEVHVTPSDEETAVGEPNHEGSEPKVEA